MKYLLLSLIIVALVGCEAQNKDDIEKLTNELNQLRHNLGEYQYLGLDPKLSFSNSNVKFETNRKSYGVDVTVRYTTNIEQNNDDFPLDSYGVTIRYVVVDSNGNEVSGFSNWGQIENGVLSLSDVQELYRFDAPTITGLKLLIKDYSWYPENRMKPFQFDE